MAGLDRGDAGLTYTGRRVEIRLAHRQADHVLARTFQLRGARRHG